MADTPTPAAGERRHYEHCTTRQYASSDTIIDPPYGDDTWELVSVYSEPQWREMLLFWKREVHHADR